MRPPTAALLALVLAAPAAAPAAELAAADEAADCSRINQDSRWDESLLGTENPRPEPPPRREDGPSEDAGR